MTVQPIGTVSELEAAQSAAQSQRCVFFFWANWHEPSAQGGQMQGVFSALSEKYSEIRFYTVEAEALPEISEIFGVAVVPTFYATVDRTIIGKVEGANPAELSKLVKQLIDIDPSSLARTSPEERKKIELQNKLELLVKLAPVMLFMKGTTDSPKCGFSRQMVEILKSNEIPFASFDILTDQDVREGLKVFFDWPTYPQLYVHAQLVGGLDIVKELQASGDLREQLGVQDLKLPPPPAPIEERLRALINQAQVMAFIKGSPSAPKCGFSRTLVGLLNEEAIEFSHFDILTDEEVRAGLKTFSDWPTYPQLYVNGALVGGLDIVKEMKDGGNLKEQLGL